jgi:hypothetical protein
MLKFLLAVAVLGGLGYAAFTVPVQRRTVADRVAELLPWEIVRKHPVHAGSAAPSSDQTKPASAQPARETITQADRAALDRLISR